MTEVRDLGVTPRRNDIPLQLLSDHSGCVPGRHRHGPYLVNAALAVVQCAECKQFLNPVFVLQQLLGHQSEFMQLHDRYQDEMRRLKERSRTKCQHCGEMTRITHR